MAKITAISDLHGDLPKIDSCDILLICGDTVPLNCQRSGQETRKWLKQEFLPWVDKLECKHVLIIPGNHDWEMFWSPDKIQKIFEKTKVKFLCDSRVVLMGIEFYGTPWGSGLPNWAFYMPHDKILTQFDNIPENLDILISHCPPANYGDTDCVLQPSYNFGSHFGCPELGEVIDKKKPKYVFCGHIHSGDHVPYTKDGVTVVNCSLKDEDYKMTYKPFTFEYGSN